LAENVYLTENVAQMGDACILYLKFVIKKSAFMKKSGKFVKANELLED
jgi:hypothetical protein